MQSDPLHQEGRQPKAFGVNTEQHPVWVALGANLASPMAQLRSALSVMDSLKNTRLIKVSSFYRSIPMGPADQPDYINAVAELSTSLSPHQLLDALQSIELAQGRTRNGERWGPRTLDLDIILFGDCVIEDERLVIPHYGAKQRNFVLLPLAEIAPDLCFPGGEKVSELLRQVSLEGIEKVANE